MTHDFTQQMQRLFTRQLERIRTATESKVELLSQDPSYPFAQQLQKFLNTHFPNAYSVRLKEESSDMQRDEKSVCIYVYDRNTAQEVTRIDYTEGGLDVYKNDDENICYAHNRMDRVITYEDEPYRLQETLYYRPEEDQAQRDAAMMSYILQCIESHITHNKSFALDDIGTTPGAHLGL